MNKVFQQTIFGGEDEVITRIPTDDTKRCERCNQEKEVFPDEHGLCEDCCNEMLLGAPTPSFDWSQIDFEKGDYK